MTCELSLVIVTHLPGAQHPDSAQDPFLRHLWCLCSQGRGPESEPLPWQKGRKGREMKLPTFFWLPGPQDSPGSWPLNGHDLSPLGLLKATGALILQAAQRADSLPEVTEARQLWGSLLPSHCKPLSPPATQRHRKMDWLVERQRNTKWWD